MYDYNKATLNLFNGLEVSNLESYRQPKIISGCLIHPAILETYDLERINYLVDKVVLSGEKLNSSFHKSWKKVRNSSTEQLVIEQILHYITTYGFEFLGIYDKDLVYIPNEKLEIPNLDDNIVLKVIKAYSKSEVKEKAMNLVKLGIALKESTIKDLLIVFETTGLSDSDVSFIKNKELLSSLCDRFGIVPKNPVEFLRFVIYKTTGKTLLIKSKEAIRDIKDNVDDTTYNFFDLYKEKYGLHELSSIFFRFKPLFLAFKEEDRMKPVINKLRRLAEFNHRPMKEDPLNTVTSNIKNNKFVDLSSLKDANIFRKIRLAYALKYRTLDDLEAIVYKIRNGKSWASNFDFENKSTAKVALRMTLDSIAESLKPNVYAKKIYIPKTIEYALPATEKQFTGNFPSGTCIQLASDMVIGIHWENFKERRVDLDLSLMDITSKLGWDGFYRSGGSILFSGDITDAPKPKGASEFFYVSKKEMGAYLVNVNYYNFIDFEENLPFDIVVAYNYKKKMDKDYLIDPNAIIASTKSEMIRRQKTIGLLVTNQDCCKFYFSEVYSGNSITSRNTKNAKNTRQYFMDSFRNTIGMREVLKRAGAVLVDDTEDADIDLSPEVLEKDTILSLMVGG
jgi:hypothetical protein